MTVSGNKLTLPRHGPFYNAPWQGIGTAPSPRVSKLSVVALSEKNKRGLLLSTRDWLRVFSSYVNISTLLEVKGQVLIDTLIGEKGIFQLYEPISQKLLTPAT